MHIWGSIALHPMTFPIADQFMHVAINSSKLVLIVYVAVVKPSVDDFLFVWHM